MKAKIDFEVIYIVEVSVCVHTCQDIKNKFPLNIYNCPEISVKCIKLSVINHIYFIIKHILQFCFYKMFLSAKTAIIEYLYFYYKHEYKTDLFEKYIAFKNVK